MAPPLKAHCMHCNAGRVLKNYKIVTKTGKEDKSRKYRMATGTCHKCNHKVVRMLGSSKTTTPRRKKRRTSA